MNNTIQMTSGIGQYHTNEPDPTKPDKLLTPYLSIGVCVIQARVDKPQQVDKPQAQWLIPSTLPSRNFKDQEQHGEYWMLWADLDKNPPPLDLLALMHIPLIIGDADFESYNSRSATLDNQKARLLIPLDEPLCYGDWTLAQQTLNDKLEELGIIPDRATERAAQLCYLPNRGDLYRSQSRRTGRYFNPLQAWAGEIATKREKLETDRLALEADKQEAMARRVALTLPDNSNRTLSKQEAFDEIKNAFNQVYTPHDWLTTGGYEQRGNTFRRPNSESGSHSCGIYTDDSGVLRANALSPEDLLFTNGNGAHDAFSVFTTLFHNGDTNAALKDAGDNLLTIDGVSWNKAKQVEYAKKQTIALLTANTHTMANIPLPPQSGWETAGLIETQTPPVQTLQSELIPEPVRPWLDDVSHRMQTPRDFPTISLIVIASSVIGAGCSIKPKRQDDWEVIPNIWGACIGRPSVVLKSPSMKEPMRLLERLQAEWGAVFELAKKSCEFDQEVLESKKKALKSQLDKATKTNVIPGVVEKLRADYMELDEAPEATRRLFKTNETSIQSMTLLQKQNPRGMLVFRDELTGLLAKWDREDGADERAYFLEGWNGNGSYTDVKIGRGLTDAKTICISLLGGIQPDKLKRYLYQAIKGNNDGLMQRLQLAVWPDEPEDWQLIDTAPNKAERQRAYDIMKALSEMDFIQYGAIKGEYDERPYFRFDDAGQKVFNQWITELQNVKIRQEENPLMFEHLGKFRSLMPSLALIFHCIDIADGKAMGNVSAQAAKLAMVWCDYLESHARRIYAMAESPEHEAAVRLADKIKAGSVHSPFTAHDVYHKGWHGLKDKQEVESACNILIDENWLQMQIKPKPATGRPPAPEYHINPKIFENA